MGSFLAWPPYFWALPDRVLPDRVFHALDGVPRMRGAVLVERLRFGNDRRHLSKSSLHYVSKPDCAETLADGFRASDLENPW